MGGRRQIPGALYEAAQFDGASPFRRLRSITVPQLSYSFVTASVLIIVGSLGYFDLFLVMTDGGPGDSTQVLAMRMYIEGFSGAQIGAGSTIASGLALVGLASDSSWSGQRGLVVCEANGRACCDERHTLSVTSMADRCRSSSAALDARTLLRSSFGLLWFVIVVAPLWYLVTTSLRNQATYLALTPGSRADSLC